MCISAIELLGDLKIVELGDTIVENEKSNVLAVDSFST